MDKNNNVKYEKNKKIETNINNKKQYEKNKKTYSKSSKFSISL